MAVTPREITFVVKVQDQSRSGIKGFTDGLGGIGTAAATSSSAVTKLQTDAIANLQRIGASLDALVTKFDGIQAAAAREAAAVEASATRQVAATERVSAAKKRQAEADAAAAAASAASRAKSLEKFTDINDLPKASANKGLAPGFNTVGGAGAGLLSVGTVTSGTPLAANDLSAANEALKGAGSAGKIGSEAASAAASVSVLTAKENALTNAYDATRDAAVAYGTRGRAALNGIIDSIGGLGTKLKGGLGLGGAAKEVEEVGAAATKAGPALAGLVNAGEVKEVVVLGKEIASGNFSRIPGSLTVLASRSGQLLPLLGVLGGLAVPLGFVAAGLKHVEDQANDSAGLDKYIQTLGLTNSQTASLKDTTITFGDTFKATFSVLAEGVLASFGQTTGGAKSFISDAETTILHFMAVTFETFSSIVITTFQIAQVVGKNFVEIFENVGTGIANALIIGITKGINFIEGALNGVGGFINGLSQKAGLGNILPELKPIQTQVKGLTDGFVTLSHINIGDAVNKNFKQTAANLDTLNKLAQQKAITDKKAAIDKQAQDIKDNQNAKKPKTPRVDDSAAREAQKQLDLVVKENISLEQQEALIGKVGIAREKYQKVQEISDKFGEAGIDVGEAQAAVANGTASAIQKLVVAELARAAALVDSQRIDKIAQATYDAGTSALQKYNDTVAAGTQLLKTNPELQDEVTKSINKAKIALDDYLDPLRELKQQTADMIALSGVRSSSLEVETKVQEAYNAAIKEGLNPDQARARADQSRPLFQAQANVSQDQDLQKKLEGFDQQIALTKVLAGSQDQVSSILEYQNQLRDAGITDQAKINSMVAVYADGLAKVKEAQKAASQDATAGFREGLEQVRDTMTSVRTEVSGLVSSTFDSLQTHLATFLQTGKLGVKSLLSDIGKSFTEASAKNLTGQLAGGLDSLLGGQKNATGQGFISQALGVNAKPQQSLLDQYLSSKTPIPVTMVNANGLPGLGGATGASGIASAAAGAVANGSTGLSSLFGGFASDLAKTNHSDSVDSTGDVIGNAAGADQIPVANITGDLTKSLTSLTSGVDAAGSGFLGTFGKSLGGISGGLSGLAGSLGSLLGGAIGGKTGSAIGSILGTIGGSFLKFRDGGIMTEFGSVPLRKYSGGGIANSPQMAMFGEGSSPEAYVPVPSGRIPVELSGAGGGATYHTTNMTVVAQDANSFRRSIPQIQTKYARGMARMSKRNG